MKSEHSDQPPLHHKIVTLIDGETTSVHIEWSMKPIEKAESFFGNTEKTAIETVQFEHQTPPFADAFSNQLGPTSCCSR